jgi:hypothetical protein
MAGLVPAIHVFVGHRKKTWMPGTEAGHDGKRETISARRRPL